MRITSELDWNWSSHVWRAVEILAGQKRKISHWMDELKTLRSRGQCGE